MVLLLQMLQQAFDICAIPLISDLFQEIGFPRLLGDRIQLLGHLLFEDRGHPYHTQQTTIGQDELRAGDVELAVAHHSGRLQTTSRYSCQCGEGHSCGGHAGVLTADDHDAVGLRDDHGDALEAAAGRHRVLHDRVHGDLVDGTMTGDLNELVDALEVALLGVDYAALLDGLVGPCWVDLL